MAWTAFKLAFDTAAFLAAGACLGMAAGFGAYRGALLGLTFCLFRLGTAPWNPTSRRM
jgi:uncharacterized membrane protein YhiD involved in acid resistance